jgi:hypothetical protein
MSKTDWNNIKKRLEDLAAASGRGERCPECGGPADGSDMPGPNDTYELLFLERGEDPQNEWCPECGRQTVTVLEWED